MLYYDFGNFEGFQERFGLRECGNGEKSRRNKILLSYIKQRRLLHNAVCLGVAKEEINLRTMDALWASLRSQLRCRSERRATLASSTWCLAGVQFFCSMFKADEYEGLCEDGDSRAVRYIHPENGRVFKMKAGKFMRKVCEEAGVAELWPEPVLVWFCEEFASKWQAYSARRLQSYELHVGDTLAAFRSIYDSCLQAGSFGSCMTDDGYHSFYYDAVKAKAAWLTNKNGSMVARCVIFTEVVDEESGEVLRLAERQYSSEGSDLLKRILVDKLIEAGEIDGYKRVGADCHNAKAFVGNDGSNWEGRSFSISCDLNPGDTLSYQDSFKWYNLDVRRAYNRSGFAYTHELDTTDGILRYDNYDSWNDESTPDEVVTVYYDGQEYTCSENRLDSFRYINYGSGEDEWHHRDDCLYCVDIEDYVLEHDALYSYLTEVYYYYEDMRDNAELEYKEKYWTYSIFDDEYYENPDDVVLLITADGSEISISVDSLVVNFNYTEICPGMYREIKEDAAA